MFSRRQFFRFVAGLGAFGASTAAYGFGIEPVLRLRVARYNILPPQWPADFQLTIAVVADLHACDPWMSLQHIEAIESCHSVAGEESYILLVRVESPRALEDLLQRIRTTANVQTRSTIILQTFYDDRQFVP